MRPHLIYERDGEEPLYVPITEEIVAEGVTFEEFLAKEWVKLGHVEWVDGYVVKMAKIELAHDQLVQWLRLLLGTLMDRLGIGIVTGDPMVMHLADAKSGRAPDIAVLLPTSAERMGRNGINGPADLVIEVISPGSRRRDKTTKFLEYERGGVREYWILDYLRTSAEFWVLSSDGHYELRDSDENGVYQSVAIPQLKLPVEMLWRCRTFTKLETVMFALSMMPDAAE
jgi:Uma2 family endonuclease